MAERRVINGYIVERQADGSLVTIGPAGGTAPQMPTDPTFQYQEPKARLDNQLTEAQIRKAALDASQAAATQPYDVRKAAADAAKAEADAATAAKGSTGSAADTQKLANLRALERQIAEVRSLYNQNLKGGNPIQALGEYLPLPQNRAFDSAGKALAETGFGAFRVPGVGSQSDAEGARFVEAYAPSASDQDSVIEQKLTNLENRLRDTYREMGIAPRETEVQPAPKKRDDMAVAGNPQGPDRSNRADVLFGQPPSDSQNGGFVPYGAETRLERNPQWKGVNEAVKGMIVSGRPAQEIKAFMNSKGIAGDAARGVDDAINYYRKTGKQDFGVDVENIQVPMSGFDQFRNNAPQTMVGTAAATALNAGGFGIPQMLAGGEGLDYLRQQNPGSAFAGDVAGVIGGTAALGKAGSTVAGKLAPSLLGGGGKAAAGRQLATDVGYGGIYGATTEGTPQGALTGALTAGLGSAGGQVIGTGIGKALKGASMSAPAQALKGMGVNNLTIGQMLGGKARSLEDAMTSAPLIGDIVNARRGEGFQDFNLAALNQAGAPIGATVNETGENGLNQLMGQVSGAYDNATAGVNAPLDAQFVADMQAASAAGQRLPPDYQVRFDKMGQNRIGPIVDAGAMTGEAYQQSMRGLKGARSSASQAAPGFEQDYRDAITLSMDALKGQMQRGGGQSVIDGLAAADNSNRLGKTIERAMGAARNGTRSGEIQVFTPSQLNDAAYAAQRKFPGPRPFAQLADAGQEVLPSQLPDSGTARRLTSIALPASLGGVGGGLGLTGGDPQTAMQGAGAGLTVGALLALGGSKAGQKALEAALFKRPKAVRRAGGIFGSRKGQQALSGLVTAPLLIE